MPDETLASFSNAYANPTSSPIISARERRILRELAWRVAEIVSQPIMAERRQMWKRHNRLERLRPMILVFPEGAWRELLPDSALQCEGEVARQMEFKLRNRIYYAEHFHDDTVIEKTWFVSKRVAVGNWGLEPKHIDSPETTGAWMFNPVLKSQADLEKLQFPQVTVDPAGTAQDLAEAQALFSDILDVQLRGINQISFHLMNIYTGLRGLEQVLWDMSDAPEMLHQAMAFLEEGHRRLVQQFVDQNLLSLNNDETYHSSGGVGYTDELPSPGFDPERIRPCDLWASSESQELHVVSPKMHAEFVLPYEKRLLAPFGLNGYGCCEDLTHKLQDVFNIPNLRRISISPFANVDICAEKLENRYIFSWKPQPAHLVGDFDTDHVRKYLRHTLEVTRGCVIEMILKDTHTCENHPERFTEWTRIARELAEEYA